MVSWKKWIKNKNYRQQLNLRQTMSQNVEIISFLKNLQQFFGIKEKQTKTKISFLNFFENSAKSLSWCCVFEYKHKQGSEKADIKKGIILCSTKDWVNKSCRFGNRFNEEKFFCLNHQNNFFLIIFLSE